MLVIAFKLIKCLSESVTEWQMTVSSTAHSQGCLVSSLWRLMLFSHSSPSNCKYLNAYNYIHTGNGLTYYIQRVGSTILQGVACTGSWSQQPVSWK